MSIALRFAGVAPRRDRLQVHRPAEAASGSTCWMINGHPATILIWTAEEWSRLVDRPEQAQQAPSGLWCLLRVD